MTLIAGYIYEDSVSILADSVLSISEIEPDPTVKSSAGEINVSGGFNQESSCKVFNLGDRVIAATSGKWNEGLRVLEDIKITLVAFQDEPASSIIHSHLSAAKSENEFIFGFIENETPTLMHKNYSGIHFSQKEDQLVINGSGGWDNDFHYLGYGMNKALRDANKDKTYCLVSMLGLFRCISLKNQTYDEGVGGFFNGALIDSDGISWAPDFTTCVYSAENMYNTTHSIIDVFNRDQGVIVASPHSGLSVYYSRFAALTYTEWKEKHLSDYNSLLDTEIGYTLFLANDHFIVTVYPGNFKKNPKFHVKDMGNGESIVKFPIDFDGPMRTLNPIEISHNPPNIEYSSEGNFNLL